MPTVQELKGECRQLGLTTGGNKAQLAARLAEYHSTKRSAGQLSGDRDADASTEKRQKKEQQP